MNKQTKVIQFHPEHLNVMDLRQHEIDNVLAIQNSRERIEALTSSGTCGTIVYDGKILGSMGIFDMWVGVCEVWVLPSVLVPQHALIFARVIKRYLDNIIELNHYKRIQVSALNDKTHNRFFEWLGFDRETPNGMKGFSLKGCNYNMWSITKG